MLLAIITECVKSLINLEPIPHPPSLLDEQRFGHAPICYHCIKHGHSDPDVASRLHAVETAWRTIAWRDGEHFCRVLPTRSQALHWGGGTIATLKGHGPR